MNDFFLGKPVERCACPYVCDDGGNYCSSSSPSSGNSNSSVNLNTPSNSSASSCFTHAAYVGPAAHPAINGHHHVDVNGCSYWTGSGFAEILNWASAAVEEPAASSYMY